MLLVAVSYGMAQPPAPRITGRYWKAIELMGQPSPTPDVGPEAHLQFDTNGRVAGSDGCNRVMGPYTLEGDALRFGELAGTRMACPGTEAVERAFHEAVKATARWRMDGDRLELLDAAGAVVAQFATPINAPGTGPATPAPTPGLAGTSWQLVRFEGGDDTVLTPDDKAKYTLQFEGEGRVAVRFDCNRGRGTWTSAGPGQLEFGPVALTRAMCPPGSLHDRLVTHWPHIRSFVLKDGHLFLSLQADGGIYEFEPLAGGR
jgi:heat shock protein HslJ